MGLYVSSLTHVSGNGTGFTHVSTHVTETATDESEARAGNNLIEGKGNKEAGTCMATQATGNTAQVTESRHVTGHGT